MCFADYAKSGQNDGGCSSDVLEQALELQKCSCFASRNSTRLKTGQLPLHGAGSEVRKHMTLDLLHKQSVAHHHMSANKNTQVVS